MGRLELFPCSQRHPPRGRQQRQQPGLGQELQLAGQWGHKELGYWACTLEKRGLFSGASEPRAREPEDPNAGAASAWALNDSSSRAAEIRWREAPCCLPAGLGEERTRGSQ